MKSIAKFSVLLIAAAVLSACGGGGGAGAPAPATATGAAAPAPITLPSAPVAAGYAAGSQQGEAFALLNSERVKCGFGSLAKSAALDAAAGGHANFLAENGTSYGHYEVAGLPGFTGVSEQHRAGAQGYLDPVAAVLAVSNGTLAASQARTIPVQVRDILAAPYHLLGAIDDYSEVGVGYASKVTNGNQEKKALNFTLGKPGTKPLDAAQVYTYPCEGSTSVNWQLANETPSPIPLNLAQDYKLYGSPIAVKLRTGRVLSLTSVTLTPAAGGTAVAAQIVDLSNTPRPDLMRADSAYLLPTSPLTPGISYTVQLAGTSDGVAFTKSFTFTTSN